MKSKKGEFGILSLLILVFFSLLIVHFAVTPLPAIVLWLPAIVFVVLFVFSVILFWFMSRIAPKKLTNLIKSSFKKR